VASINYFLLSLISHKALRRIKLGVKVESQTLAQIHKTEAKTIAVVAVAVVVVAHWLEGLMLQAVQVENQRPT
jgi:hypothetical protein